MITFDIGPNLLSVFEGTASLIVCLFLVIMTFGNPFLKEEGTKEVEHHHHYHHQEDSTDD